MLVVFNTNGPQAVQYETTAQLFHVEQDDRAIMYAELVNWGDLFKDTGKALRTQASIYGVLDKSEAE